MNRAIEDALIELLVSRLATRATAADMVDWATAALVAGEASPSLDFLAGLDGSASVFDAMPWFEKALSELGIAQPPDHELRRAFVGVVSRSLLDGRISPDQALDQVHEHAVSPLGHPDDLSAWCFVWERLGPGDYRSLPPAEVKGEAHRLAAEWASRPGLSLKSRAAPDEDA
ncbi:MAG TPA: hypothetical protein VFD64_00585 [Gemmatimonadaceae bacterium]|nr:hypothetical protein [Gemmatimonadaceae bacterium]